MTPSKGGGRGGTVEWGVDADVVMTYACAVFSFFLHRLDYNKIGDVGAEALASAIAKNTTLTDLE